MLRERAGELTGILNGVDYAVWNPATDPRSPATTVPTTLRASGPAKPTCSASFNLPVRPDVMLIGMISRLVAQKGFDLLRPSWKKCSRAIFSSSCSAPATRSTSISSVTSPSAHRENARVVIGFDDALAHRIEAGADAFLMPSQYEPSGLNQLYSLKYGTLPIVRSTGGLRDSIHSRNGFVFEPYDAAALLETIDRALAVFSNRTRWTRLMRNAMTSDHSWDRSAAAYVDLYRSLLQQ